MPFLCHLKNPSLLPNKHADLLLPVVRGVDLIHMANRRNGGLRIRTALRLSDFSWWPSNVMCFASQCSSYLHAFISLLSWPYCQRVPLGRGIKVLIVVYCTLSFCPRLNEERSVIETAVFIGKAHVLLVDRVLQLKRVKVLIFWLIDYISIDRHLVVTELSTLCNEHHLLPVLTLYHSMSGYQLLLLFSHSFLTLSSARALL